MVGGAEGGGGGRLRLVMMISIINFIIVLVTTVLHYLFASRKALLARIWVDGRGGKGVAFDDGNNPHYHRVNGTSD